MNEETNTATVEELIRVPAEELRAAWRAYARWKWAVNGYEMIEFLQRLTEGCIGYELLGSISEKVACYCKGENNSGGVQLPPVERSSVEALLRMKLVESQIRTSDSQPRSSWKIYLPTPDGEKFFSTVPETCRGGEPAELSSDEGNRFWIAIVKDKPNEQPAVYPYVAAEAPDARTILSLYGVAPTESSGVRITGPHSLREIPPSALCLDAYPTVGPRIIRSWFDTVINPILENLKLEEKLLVQRNWTWRVPPSHLESIRSIVESAWQVSVDNLEQLITFYPNVEDLIERHDQEESELEDACRALHEALSTSSAIKEAYGKAKQDDALTEQGTAVNSVLHGSDDQHLDLLAQYIVNNAEELPNYYVHSSVWNKYRSEFLSSLEDPAISPLRNAAVQAGEKLLGTVNELSALLKEIRSRLSLQFDVPFVTSQSATDE